MSKERSRLESENFEIVDQFIKGLNLDVGLIRNLPSSERGEALRNILTSPEEISQCVELRVSITTKLKAPEFGLAFVKPELETETAHFLNYLYNLGTSPQLL